MLRPGQIFSTEKGQRVEIQGFAGNGSQGDVYRARGTDGRILAMKVFQDASENQRIRTAFTVRNLAGLSPAVLAPIDRVLAPDMLATLSPFITGSTLEAWLQESPRAGNLKLRLIMAIGLAAAVESFHAKGWTPGDLGSDQFIVEETPSLAKVRMVDVDSVVADGIPVPRTLGKLPYFSPELRKAYLDGGNHPITPQSDLFSLGVLLHEVLLLRHPAEGYVDPEEIDSYHRVMSAGWPGDPLAGHGGEPEGLSGFSVATLDPNTQRILRLALHPKPSMRPSAAAMKTTLGSALCRMTTCPACSCWVIAFNVLSRCPHRGCAAPFRSPRLCGQGFSVVLDRPELILGRAEFPDPHVSRRHLRIRTMGPCIEIENIGSNGTFIREGEGWSRMADGTPRILRQGDRILLGNLELRLAA